MSGVRKVGIIGGTGAEGRGLALRLAHAGLAVVIGSRDSGRAEEAAEEINARLGIRTVSGASMKEAAAEADIVLMTVPYSAQQAAAAAILSDIRGKILIDATVPLLPPKVSQVQLPQGGSAVAALQRTLGDDVKVVAAFQNVSAHHLDDLDHEVDCDVLVFGDDVDARETVVSLANRMGLRGIHGGPIANAAAAEALTSVLIAINRRYKVSGSGIRITGI